MEARLIYESDKIYLNKVVWDFFQEDSEWHYIGNENIRKEKVDNIITQNFSDDTLYIVVNRNDSQEISKTEILDKIVTLINDVNFTIWDKKFQRVIEFNNNGIFRIGQREFPINIG